MRIETSADKAKFCDIEPGAVFSVYGRDAEIFIKLMPSDHFDNANAISAFNGRRTQIGDKNATVILYKYAELRVR